MKKGEMKKLIKHFDLYFEQSDGIVVHPIVDNGLHIDVLLYKPNPQYPFWKLVTMGASDYKMPEVQNSFGQYNEYIMFVSSTVDLLDKEVLAWYHNKLLLIATYAYLNKTHITYGHSFEWKNGDPEDEMIAAYIELPRIIQTTAILRCKLGLSKTVICLQVVLLNQQELDKLMEIGPDGFSDFLYPPMVEDECHFFSEQHRSAEF